MYSTVYGHWADNRGSYGIVEHGMVWLVIGLIVGGHMVQYGMVWYGMVIRLMVGRGQLPLALPSSSLLPPTKEFLLLQFLICCIVQDPQGRRMAVDIISARILSGQILHLPA